MVLSLACIAAAIYGWRQRREDYLVRLVTDFNAALDEQRYDRAEQLAKEALREFPQEFAAEFMVEKSQLAKRIMDGVDPGELGGFQCR